MLKMYEEWLKICKETDKKLLQISPRDLILIFNKIKRLEKELDTMNHKWGIISDLIHDWSEFNEGPRNAVDVDEMLEELMEEVKG